MIELLVPGSIVIIDTFPFIPRIHITIILVFHSILPQSKFVAQVILKFTIRIQELLKDLMLVRKQINKLLSSYYNQPHNAVVGSIPSQGYESDAINFRSILGEWHWRRIYQDLYKNQAGQWLTPVELFRPYYSGIIANFIATEFDKVKKSDDNSKKIDVVELGGGRGTNCLCILDCLQNKHPEVYENLDSYTIMDSSPTLLNLMKKVLVENPSLNSVYNEELQNSQRHHNKVVLKNVDMMDIAERSSDMLPKSDKPTFVFAMELLDNLAHDKVTSCEKTGEILQGEIMPSEENISVNSLPIMKEIFLPLSDALLQDILTIQPKYIPTKTEQYGCEWIPSVACGVLKNMIIARPNSSAVFADFDWLPSPQMESGSVQIRRSLKGSFEPLITCMNDIDHLCYMTAPPLCDILFPTDFPLLAGYTQQLLDGNNIKSEVNVMKQSEFLSKFGNEEVEKTKGWLTGYTPLLQDFTNCSVMTISSRHE